MLGETLRRTWEKMAGIYIPEKIMSEISQWKIEVMTPQEITHNLEYMLEVKCSNPSIWEHDYLSKEPVINFIKLIIDSDKKYEHDRGLMQKLIEEAELSKLEIPCGDQISKWLFYSDLVLESSKMLNGIINFQSFNRYLEEILKESSGFLVKQLRLPAQAISEDISKAILSLRSHIKNTYDDVLITIITYTFQNKQENIEVDDLEHLHRHFKEQNVEYSKKKSQSLHLQVYLFQLAISICPESEARQVLSIIVEMMLKLDPPLHEELLDLYDSHCPLFQLKQSLGEISTRAYSSSTAKNSSLKDILEKAMNTHTMRPVDYSTNLNNNQEVKALLEILQLTKQYSTKLQLQDALRISLKPLKLSLIVEDITDEHQLPEVILHKLMAYDSQSRSQTISQCPQETLSLSSLDELGSEDEVQSDDHPISPYDSLLAVLICSDNFLRQDLLSRLAKCQLSVPFILPDPFTKQLTIHLWALQSIIKEWKYRNSNGQVVQHTHPIISYKMPIVFFGRFGKHSKYSKSQILNELISGSVHHFFHRNHPGGRLQHHTLLGDGLVDMCWYLPRGRPSDAFPDAVTFFNLHGDAREHLQQTIFLSKISSMCFVLLTEEDLEFDEKTMAALSTLSSSPVGVTILAEVSNLKAMKTRFSALKKKIPNVHLINLYQKNVPDQRGEILKKINRHFSHSKLSIEESSRLHFRALSIFVDENNLLCKRGLQLTKKVKEALTSGATTAQMLPLQGDGLWMAWAAKNREEYRQKDRGEKLVNNYDDELKKAQTKKREQQIKYIKSLTPLMESFLSSLLMYGGEDNKTIRNHFIQSLKLELNKLSSEKISESQLKYQSIRNQLQTLDKKCDSYKSQLEELNELQKYISSSFGFEHLLREFGQMYEAIVTIKKNDCGIRDVSRLPKAAAELLIDGWPLEVMDGDAAHVPIKWVTAVLKEAAKKLNDPKVFVLSVLGLQSSGKSTLLNTVFGLQFYVGAGRCTRGAFMQLLPLDEELRREIKCDYVLVVDTEGLRALSLNPDKSQQHDNELATFVIGLANMTLINIYGEVPGDMEDILQTAVHALLRMKRVKVSSSCQFLHQNTGSNLKTKVGSSQFAQKLDEYTLLAAKEENCETEYKCFNDVIKFNDETDIYYFPALWEGDPPMAPVNQGYSIAAQIIKLDFIEHLKENSNAVNLSLFPEKINNLWTNLLNEDFVFSFKNTLEVIAYKTLEIEWSRNWRWPFHQKILSWERKVENTLSATKSQQFIHDIVQKKCKDLKKYVEATQDEISKEMDAFFDKQRSEAFLQLKPRFQRMLKKLSTDLMEHAEKRCIQLGEIRTTINKYATERTKHTELIKNGVRAHIADIRKNSVKKGGEQTKQEIEARFNTLWDQLITQVPRLSRQHVDVQLEVQDALLKFRGADESNFKDKLRTKQLREWGSPFRLKVQHSKHYNMTRYKDRAKILFGYAPSKFNLEQKAQVIADEILNHAQTYLDQVAAEKQDFWEALALNLLQEMDKKIETETKQMANNITFTWQFRCDALLVVCGYSIHKFEEMIEAFNEQIDLRSYLENNVRPIVFMQFKNECEGVQTEDAIANTICASLEKPIKEQVAKSLGSIIVGQMKISEHQYFSSKMALKAKILTDLLEEDDFEGYMAYVENVKKCLQERIKSYAVNYCDMKVSEGKTRLQEAAQKQVDILVKKIELEVDDIKLTDTFDWLAAFCESKTLQEELGLNIKPDDLIDDDNSHPKLNVENFNESIMFKLDNLKEQLHKVFSDIRGETEMANWPENPYEIIKKEAVGCTEQCPFCKEQCDCFAHTEGEHRSAIHRPFGVSGWRFTETQIMMIDLCPALIKSNYTFKNKDTNNECHPYKDYKQFILIGTSLQISLQKTACTGSGLLPSTKIS